MAGEFDSASCKKQRPLELTGWLHRSSNEADALEKPEL